MGGQMKWGLGVDFFLKKKEKKSKKWRSAMGVVEGWPGYWFRGSSCHGYGGWVLVVLVERSSRD